MSPSKTHLTAVDSGSLLIYFSQTVTVKGVKVTDVETQKFRFVGYG